MNALTNFAAGGTEVATQCNNKTRSIFAVARDEGTATSINVLAVLLSGNHARKVTTTGAEVSH